MIQKLDGKFSGEIVKNKDGSTVPPDQWVAFLAKDNAFALMVQRYPICCQEVGADESQVQSAFQLVARINQWRKENPDKCKAPDVLPGEVRF